MIRNLPNLISALRLLAAPLAAGLILHDHDTAALLVFAAAGTSDALDGFIARHWGMISRVGSWLDPAADKLLMLLCFIALLLTHAASPALVALVVIRDLAIAAGWMLARLLHLPIAQEALPIGKLSTLAQVCYVGLLLLLLAFDRTAPALEQLGVWIVGALALLSAIAYAQLFLRTLFAGRRTV